MNKPTSLAALLQAGDGNAVAIGAPDRETMSRAELVRLVDQVGGALRGMGIKAEDKVAIVMPNGPEMAAAFVASPAGPAPRRSIRSIAPTSSVSISATSMPRR